MSKQKERERSLRASSDHPRVSKRNAPPSAPKMDLPDQAWPTAKQSERLTRADAPPHVPKLRTGKPKH